MATAVNRNGDRHDMRMTVDVVRRGYSGPCWHVYAQPVYIKHGEAEPFSQHQREEWHLAQLVVSCQGDLRSTNPPYAWQVAYHGVTDFELARMEACVKQLRRVHKRLDAMAAQLGRPETFAQLVIRVGLALGIRQFGFPNTKRSRWASGYRHEWVTAEELPSWIEMRVQDLREERAPFEVIGAVSVVV
jgi:hypothetical protein